MDHYRESAVDVPGGTVLSSRQLNRALLARQGLLERSLMQVTDALEHLVGMQSQVPSDPYIGLWSRLEKFATDELSGMMQDRAAVRASLMRGTIHLVTVADYLMLQPVMRVLHERVFPRTDQGKRLDPTCVPEILEAAREMLAETPLSMKALGVRLAERWSDCDPGGMAQAVRFLLPLVQVTPRGIWGASYGATWALAEQWIGRPVPDNPTPDAVLLRYLAAFGPATVADMQAWSGLQGLRAAVERMRPHLCVFRNEKGQELFDVPGAPLPDPETPAPVRFLPGFGNVLLSHADRTRIVAEEHRKAIGSRNGLFLATVLVDGFVAGTWGIEKTKESATLRIVPFVTLSPGDHDAIRAEGERLLSFLAGGLSHEVVIGRGAG
jgi:hypothetical protein